MYLLDCAMFWSIATTTSPPGVVEKWWKILYNYQLNQTISAAMRWGIHTWKDVPDTRQRPLRSSECVFHCRGYDRSVECVLSRAAVGFICSTEHSQKATSVTFASRRPRYQGEHRRPVRPQEALLSTTYRSVSVRTLPSFPSTAVRSMSVRST